MFFKKNYLCYLGVCVFGFLSAMEKCPVSYLELVPGQGKKPVALAHPYASITAEERSNSVYLQEANYSKFDHEQDEGKCIIIGPLQPCIGVFLTFLNNESNKKITYIAHLSLQSDLSDLLEKIKKDVSAYDQASITGKLFTNKVLRYKEKLLFDGKKRLSYYEAYGCREQSQVMRDYKTSILNAFGIVNRDQITGLIFTSNKKDFELHDYELAELFLKVSIFGNNLIINNTCPMAENYFGYFNNILSINERWQKSEQARASIVNPADSKTNLSENHQYRFFYKPV